MPTDETRPSYGGDGKPTRIPSSKDGRGEIEPIPQVKPGTRYIYYRLYTKDGPLESNHPIYSNDRFISRIASTSVRPPQTAASLTKYLCKIEGLELRKCALYQSPSDKTALDDSTRLLFRGTSGPGPSDVDPVALIVDVRAAEKRSQALNAVESQELLERDYEQRYMHYRVYDDYGEIVSKTSFGENTPTLGRVNILSVPPPYTVFSLKSCIIKSEDILGHNVQLFEDEASDSAMNDSDALTLLPDTFPGCIEDLPIAITYESGTKNGSADNEDPNEIQTRELREALSQMKKELEEANLTHARQLEVVNRKHGRELEGASRKHARELEESNRKHAHELAEVRDGWKKAKETHEREINEGLSTLRQLKVPLTFTKKLKANEDSDFSPDATWHSVKTGEIFYTDGIYRKEKYRGRSKTSEYGCYLATNSSGKLASWTDFC
ncbi:hypothetical protein K443DRAFT_685274 [Laccaria amethystina LaAM-08-1]|uniref:Uncharacterized protein n=1 Tax=Laccaria amethystina LaAM-08-1 TaxID=1095629 RepID=A0A0C9X7T2_9AGAR|nr:hypothetical protein K443DRAFT_685274 [Laccaria amethystina LaAM-08-1]